MQKISESIDPAALVRAAQANPADFAALYDCYVDRIYRFIYSLAGNPSDAEDLTSQTFLTAFEALPRYRENGYFSAWLFRIARNKANDHFRKKKPEVRLDSVEIGSMPELLFEQVAQAQDVSKVSALVKKLKIDERELIHLRYVADLSFAEMAVLLGKREDAVKKSLYRLLTRLQEQMEVRHE